MKELINTKTSGPKRVKKEIDFANLVPEDVSVIGLI